MAGTRRGLSSHVRRSYPSLFFKVSTAGKIRTTLRSLNILKLFAILDIPTTRVCSTCSKLFSLKAFSLAVTFCSPTCSSLGSLETTTRTCLQRYGAECSFQVASCLEKRQKTWKRNLGVTHPSKAESIKKKKSLTSMTNYGTLHPMQHPEVFKKTVSTRYARKTFLDLKTNQVHTYQGYEGIVLHELSQNPNVKSFKSLQDAPLAIPYAKGKQVYFPDSIAKLKSGRTILIEVKSTWTIGGEKNPNVLSVNLLKFKAAEKFCIKKGWEFWLALVDDGSIKWIKSPSCHLNDL